MERLKSSKSSRSPPKSKSPEKKTSKSAKLSSDSKRRLSSKSPKRKSTTKLLELQQQQQQPISILPTPTDSLPKSNPEVEDLSNQGLTTLNAKIFQSTSHIIIDFRKTNLKCLFLKLKKKL
jgi:hypothetical protein